MKCIDCQGTGLENEAKLCQSCKGYGKIGEDEVVAEATTSEENVGRTSVATKVRAKVASIKKAIKK